MQSNQNFYAVIEVDEPDYQKTRVLNSSRNEDSQIQGITEHFFQQTKNGCLVTEIDAPTEYPRGLSFTFWLTDCQKDGLVYLRDLIEKNDSKALKASHGWSLQMLANKWALTRMMGRAAERPTYEAKNTVPSATTPELSEAKLQALLTRLGSDFETNGSTAGPMPLVTLEEFFDGNDDEGSFQGGHIKSTWPALKAIRDRDDVSDIRMGVTQWEGQSTWPLAEYIYIVTSAPRSNVKHWLKQANIWVDELETDDEHRNREELPVPDGQQVIWAWVD